MILQLETAIKNKLEEITDFAIKEDGTPCVYDFFTLETEGFPYASFELSGFDGEYEDSCTILRDYKFNLMIIQEVSKVTRQEAKEIIYNLLDKIVEKFDGQQELGENLIVNGKIIKGEMGTLDGAEGKVVGLNIEISLQFKQEMG